MVIPGMTTIIASYATAYREAIAKLGGPVLTAERRRPFL
jgi:hypothetical protein